MKTIRLIVCVTLGMMLMVGVNSCEHKKIFQDEKNAFVHETKSISQPFSVHVEQLFFSPETDAKSMVLEPAGRVLTSPAGVKQ